MSPKEKAYLLAIALLLVTFAAQSGPSIRRESVTFDEPASIGSAYLAFRKGDLRLSYEKPPLLGLFITLPIFLGGDPPLPELDTPGDRAADLRFGDAFLHDAGGDTLFILHTSRWVVLTLSLGLGAAVAVWAHRLGGWEAALLASFVSAFSPNLLAHSRIAAGDMVCAIFSFLSVLTLYFFSLKPTPSRSVLAGVLLGMALTSKLTAVFVIPVYALVVIVLMARSKQRRDRIQTAALLLLMGISAWLALGFCLGGQFDYGAYFGAFHEIYALANPGYEFYMAGQFSLDPWWYYHLFAALIKTPISFLLLVGIGLYVILRSERDRWLEYALVIAPVMVLLLLSCFDRANIGLRRILPIYPFMVVIASQSVRLPWRRTVLGAFLVAMVGWQSASVLASAPHHLSYFNELVGGPERGAFYLDDSNIDWGQDLPSLAAWLREHPASEPRFAYSGKGRTETYGFSLPEMSMMEACRPRKDLYVVSVHRLVDFDRFSRRIGHDCGWLRRYSPVDRVAYSMFVFDFRSEVDHNSSEPTAAQ